MVTKREEKAGRQEAGIGELILHVAPAVGAVIPGNSHSISHFHFHLYLYWFSFKIEYKQGRVRDTGMY